MKDVLGDMGEDINPHRLHVHIDAELDEAYASEVPAIEQPEIEDYKTRLRSLHDAVVEMELYEEGLDET